MSARSSARRELRPYDFRGIDNAIELFFGDKTELESGRFVGRSLDKGMSLVDMAHSGLNSAYRIVNGHVQDAKIRLRERIGVGHGGGVCAT